MTTVFILIQVSIVLDAFNILGEYNAVISRYKILASQEMTNEPDDKKAAQICFDKSALDPESYRLGKTKVTCTLLSLFVSSLKFPVDTMCSVCKFLASYLYCYACVLQVFFRAGVLGSMEELRDDRLGKIVAWLQAWMRGFISRIEYKRLQAQRVALVVVQRNVRKFMALKSWPWFNLWQKVKPILNKPRIEDEIRKLRERSELACENLENELKLKAELEISNASLLEEKNNLMIELESSKGNMAEFLEQQAKLQAQKHEVEVQLTVSMALLFQFVLTLCYKSKIYTDNYFTLTIIFFDVCRTCQIACQRRRKPEKNSSIRRKTSIWILLA